jgi:glycosyltransferase involved in cell wall biosynthesis
MLRVLTLTTLFPNSVQPSHGVFVRQRLQHLVATHAVDVRVVAPVPWYPRGLPGPPEYTRYRRIPDSEAVGPFKVAHPRYVVLPKIGMSAAPTLMAVSLLAAIRRIVTAEPFDLIDAHYFYPDGVAAAWIAERLALPLVITARGTDINFIPKYAIPRRQILWAAHKASAIITVCDALRDELIELGATPAKITTLRNGFDPKQFHPEDRAAARAQLGVAGRTLLSVGLLIERKGHHIVIEALALLPDDVNLIIVGSGPMERELKALVRRLALDERVRFEGPVDHAKLKLYYSASDALLLASSREGMANVLIESIACGCPVVATDTWGTPEVIRAPEAGLLVGERSAAGFAKGIRQLFSAPPERSATLRYAEQFRWDPTSAGQFEIFNRVAEGAVALPAS